MAGLMSEHFPVSIFYECKKKKTQNKTKKLTAKLMIYSVFFFSLRIVNLFQNHTFEEIKLKDKTTGKHSVFKNMAPSF